MNFSLRSLLFLFILFSCQQYEDQNHFSSISTSVGNKLDTLLLIHNQMINSQTDFDSPENCRQNTLRSLNMQIDKMNLFLDSGKVSFDSYNQFRVNLELRLLEIKELKKSSDSLRLIN